MVVDSGGLVPEDADADMSITATSGPSDETADSGDVETDPMRSVARESRLDPMLDRHDLTREDVRIIASTIQATVALLILYREVS